MSTTDNSPIDDRSSADLISVTELQCQLNDFLKQLSPERLQVLVDFAAYLANTESEAATQELVAIPGLLERIKKTKQPLKPNTQTGELFAPMYEVLLHPDAQEVYVNADKILAKKSLDVWNS